jgi:hypothetical protein
MSNFINNIPVGGWLALGALGISVYQSKNFNDWTLNPTSWGAGIVIALIMFGHLLIENEGLFLYGAISGFGLIGFGLLRGAIRFFMREVVKSWPPKSDLEVKNLEARNIELVAENKQLVQNVAEITKKAEAARDNWAVSITRRDFQIVALQARYGEKPEISRTGKIGFDDDIPTYEMIRDDDTYFDAFYWNPFYLKLRSMYPDAFKN